MDLSWAALGAAVRLTLESPRQGARMVLQSGVPVSARWIALAITAILSAVLAHVSFGMMRAQMSDEFSNAISSPFRTAIFQATLMVIASNMITWGGRWRGGVGRFNDALILVVWLQFILLILQAAQIVAQLAFPFLAQILGFLSIAIFLWLLSNFIVELHKFTSVGKTFVAILLTIVAMAFVLALVMLPFMEPVVN